MTREMHGTTVIAVAREGRVAIAGDGQITVGATVVKAGAVKVRKIHEGRVLVGFAGSTADAMALLQRFESKLDEYRGNIARAAVELARDWRTDRALRRLEALLVVADGTRMFLLTGAGDVVEPDDGIVGIGSGGSYALAAARALLKNTTLTAREIATEALAVAASICVYTNDRVTIEEIGA